MPKRRPIICPSRLASVLVETLLDRDKSLGCVAMSCRQNLSASGQALSKKKEPDVGDDKTLCRDAVAFVDVFLFGPMRNTCIAMSFMFSKPSIYQT